MAKKSKVTVEKKAAKRGRPVSDKSARQARLARFEEVRAAGGVVKRGRPKGPEKPAKVKKVKEAKPAKAAKPAKVATPKVVKPKKTVTEVVAAETTEATA
jgi:hypothetical protein